MEDRLFYNADGQPDPNGQFQMISGKLCMRDGARVSFDRMLMDAAPGAPRTFHDAKNDPPKSIDAALQARFAQEAKKFDQTTKEWLSTMPQHAVSEIAAEVAADFVAQHAQHGVANQFSSQFGR